MFFGLEKSGRLVIKREKVVKVDEMELPAGQIADKEIRGSHKMTAGI